MSPRTSIRIALGAALAAAACSGRTDASPPAAPPPGPSSTAARPTGPITVRDPGGATTLELSVAGTSCTAKLGDAALTVARDGDATRIAGAPLAIERTAGGDQISRNDVRVARIWRDPARPGKVDVLDPDGIALVRVSVTGAQASLVDAARSPVSRVVFEGGRFVAKDLRDAVLAYVSGGDTELAALLTAPLPPDVRAVAACDRLLPAPAPVSP